MAGFNLGAATRQQPEISFQQVLPDQMRKIAQKIQNCRPPGAAKRGHGNWGFCGQKKTFSTRWFARQKARQRAQPCAGHTFGFSPTGWSGSR